MIFGHGTNSRKLCIAKKMVTRDNDVMCVADIVQIVRKSSSRKIYCCSVPSTEIEAMDKKLKRHHNHKKCFKLYRII